jgi:uncharacterized protein
MEAALFALGEEVAKRGSVEACAPSPARDLLLGIAPRLSRGEFAKRDSETAVEFAVRIAGKLDRTVLPIQGPPGSGKTYGGARMICELVRRGKKVGVTANSHKVIHNLLEAVLEEANKARQPVRVGHKVNDDDDEVPADVEKFVRPLEALDALESNAIDVIGGTAWLWARDDYGGVLDVLFVDEAGQMSLANTLAVSPAANSLVLLGDPRQLNQPIKGTHPEGVGVSALQHVLGDHKTIPDDRGIFLPLTWRLAPSICAFTSEVFYEGKLESKPGLERQVLVGAGEFDGSGLWVVDVAHDGNRNVSMEEVEVVAELVERLTARGVRWVDERGVRKQMKGDDILVVAPYNAQVSRLTERLAGTGVRAGTVDKFQGQERPVVIYSMATSRPEDAPRGMEFLYSPNRLNVATSRARCAAILVASPLLFEPECRSVRQMLLANGVCRYRELVRFGAARTVGPARAM